MSAQPDMFGATPHNTSPLTGLVVQLQRTIDQPCDCGDTSVTIGKPAGPHVAALFCARCGKHRGRLPKRVANFLAQTASAFGTSSSPIIIRDSSNSGPQSGEPESAAHCSRP
jgi:hypothetical protein